MIVLVGSSLNLYEIVSSCGVEYVLREASHIEFWELTFYKFTVFVDIFGSNEAYLFLGVRPHFHF